MKEWEEEVLGQYDIDIVNTRKVRNGLLCESENETFLLEKTGLSQKRLETLVRLEKILEENGFENIDAIVTNKEEQVFCEVEDGSKYILKRWFMGHECDVKKENELLGATRNLTRLHKVMAQPISWEGNQPYEGEDLGNVFFRHNRELKKVRSFMRDRVDKGSFELSFLQNFDAMYQWAEYALERLGKSNYEELEKKLIHGDYNYHNLLMTHDGIATTNFEHFEYNIQVTDFYYFLRKTMEKHHWDVRLGSKMMEQYHKMRPISKDEMEYMSICIAYPEKFWKAANSYLRSRKAWISAKSLEKLELVIRQTEEKQIFLEKVFDFCL